MYFRAMYIIAPLYTDICALVASEYRLPTYLLMFRSEYIRQ